MSSDTTFPTLPNTFSVRAAQAAYLLGISPGTLANWRSSGAGPRYIRTETGTLLYRVEDLRAWLDAQAGA